MTDINEIKKRLAGNWRRVLPGDVDDGVDTDVAEARYQDALAYLRTLPPAMLHTQIANEAGHQVPLILWAAQEYLTPAVKALAELGADVNSRDRLGSTPLHWIAPLSDVECVRTLLAAGAKVNAQDKRKRAPLHQAACGVADAVTQLLLAAGAEIEVRTDQGRTPLHLAACRAPHGDYPHVPFVALIEAGADVNAADDEGQTALHWAAMGRYPTHPRIRRLLELGADVNAVTIKGQAPLHYAVSVAEDIIAVDTLIDAGADIHAVDNSGQTAMDMLPSEPRQDAKRIISENLLQLLQARLRRARVGAALKGEPTSPGLGSPGV